jgi:signal transduction histidine kinase
VGCVERPTRPSLLDLGLSAVLLAVAVTEVIVVPGIAPKVPAMATEVTMALALAFRRVHPLPVTFVVAAAGLLESAAGVPLSQPIMDLVASVIAVFTVCTWERPRIATLGSGAFVAAFALQSWLSGEGLGNWLFGATFVVLTFVAGQTIRARTAEAVRLNEEMLRRERQREDAARTAVLNERSRLARELHDVISHAVSLMVVQAGAAERVSLAAGPDGAEQVRSSLRDIQVAGRQAVTELAGLLGVLRDGDEGIGLGPQPGLADLGELFARSTSTGVRVVPAVPTDLAVHVVPAGIQLAAYRIIQEALTNVRKHSAAQVARIELRVAGDALLLTVTDPGPVRLGGPAAEGAGYGLRGARERASIYGGELTAGRTDDGGFRVAARLPLDASS